MITKPILNACVPNAPADIIERYVQPLNDAMGKYDISTPLRQAHFIAQLAHESGDFKHTSENLNYSARGLQAIFPRYFKTLADAQRIAFKPEEIANLVYGYRMGNALPGDGWKYRGRGLIGITGKQNYSDLAKDTGIDFINHPELLEGPVYAALCAGWYWNKYKINAMADADDLVAVTRRINGGTIGLESRKEYLALAKKAFQIA